VVRGTFSPARAWRPAVVARLALTLGSVKPTLQHLTGTSAYWRSPNSHEDIRPRGHLATDLQVNAAVAEHWCRRHQIQIPGHAPAVYLRHVKPSQVELPRLSREQSLKSVLGSAAVNATSNRRFFAGGFRLSVQATSCSSPQRSVPRRNHRHSGARPIQRRSKNATLPNPSLNRTSYGRPPWPELRYAVHSLSLGQGVLPPLAG